MDNELYYYIAQRITEKLYSAGLISFDEYEKLTILNRQTFQPFLAEIMPKPVRNYIAETG